MEKTINCLHNIDNTCALSSEIAGCRVPIHEPTCVACMSCNRPRRFNYHTLTLARIYHPELESSVYEEIIEGQNEGFGTMIAKTFDLMFEKDESCACPGRQDILDSWHPGMIRKRMNEIVTWFQEEAMRRNLPFSRPLCRMLLLAALKYYEHRLR